jgi:hypothetical protein
MRAFACCAAAQLGLWAATAWGQVLVQELGGGVGLQGVRAMVNDILADDLLVAGAFTYAHGVQVSPGIQRWGSAGLQSVGCGVAWDCVAFINEAGLQNPANAVARWNGDLFLGGQFFFTRDGIEYNRIMRWDGTAWHPLAGGTDGRVMSIKVIDDELIVAGWFTYADTVLTNGLARWDGTRWHRVLDVPQFSPGLANYVNDVEKYQDEWHLGGNLLSPARDFVKWNGLAWEPVGGGFLGTFSQVNKLRIHDGRLYVAGSFSRCPEHAGVPSNPGSGVVAWDGQQWDDLGGGTCGAYNGTVVDLTWWNEELYACGSFNVIGWQPGSGLAKWNGEHWCMLTPPGYWGNGGANALAVHHDSLYIGGAFLTAGPDSVSCFAKWVGGDYTYSCGAVSIPEVPAPSELTLHPNPVGDLLQFVAPAWVRQGDRIQILDAVGREVMSLRFVPDIAIPTGMLASGSYSLRIMNPESLRSASARFVKALH